jgi:2-polyprenyl-3-methyl-5-hydroxy-6-metoxy-1,4-benzoquinol methylase
MELSKNIENLNEEIYCLNYELKTLTELYFYHEAERWVYKFMHKKTELEHISRYKYILKYLNSKNVLDIACGSGYGSYLIATEGKASQVIGVDLDSNAVKYGNIRHSHENIIRFAADATTFKYENKFDIVVSFETIEHIDIYKELINNLYDNLIDGGYLFISTPITKKTNSTPKNPFHVIEWDFFDFHSLFSDRFIIKEIILQNIVINKGELNFFQKALNKLYYYFVKKNKISNKIYGAEIEVYTNQYNMNLCTSGYQMLILEKKC